ncbi:MAG TPA: proline--tRNA ligase [Patescibacteria group bacterium]|nr:proline--tRNA ligase [Patescibacteria group bacterium]
MEKDKGKKLVEAITSMDVDFAQWYTDVVKKAELCDYSSVRGCMILRPYGYAIWENIQRYMDDEFKATGHENVYMPMFIPESLLQKEKDHVAGFAPEVAWVTHGGSEPLTERLCVRPTSETLFCEHFAKIVQSYKDLPKLYNQWCSVVRWEKTTRPFLRSLEFLWQEGHTIHATAEEAQAETIQMLDIYAKTCEEFLAIPVLKGKKTDKEKFAGAESTYTVESLMHDGKSLQCGTSHYFGDGFAQAFGIQYTDKEGKLQYVHETSWGVSTRIIGALIMVHGDDSGLVLPPKVAPIQLMIVPIATHKEGVIEKATELKNRMAKIVRTRMDISDKQPGWKFSEYEMKGVPLRLEVGPKDIEKNQVVLVRRDTREKTIVSMDDIETRVPQLLDEIHAALLAKARAAQEAKTCAATSVEELKEILDRQPGFVKAMWCGDQACEDKVKEVATATSRCIPFAQEKVADTCLCCGKPTNTLVVWGRAY